MKLKKKHSEVFYFINLLQSLNLKNGTKAKEFAAAATRSLDKAVVADYNSDIESLRIKHCAVNDSTKIILRNSAGGYEFTRDGMEAFIKDSRALNEKAVEFNINQAPVSEFKHLDPDVVNELIDFGLIAPEPKAAK